MKLEKAEVEEIYGVTYAGAWDVRKVSEAVVWEGIVAALSAAEGDEWRELLEGDLQVSLISRGLRLEGSCKY